MSIAEEKDTFDSFQKKYQGYRSDFNNKFNWNIQDDVERFDVNSCSGRTLAAVVLMLVHNHYKLLNQKQKVKTQLPTLQNIRTYDLAKLETIDISMFAPYIHILREGKKEKKASGGAPAAEVRQAKFNATFFIYLEIIKRLGIKILSDSPNPG